MYAILFVCIRNTMGLSINCLLLFIGHFSQQQQKRPLLKYKQCGRFLALCSLFTNNKGGYQNVFMVDNTIKWSLLVYTNNIDKIAFSKHIFMEFECSFFFAQAIVITSFLHLFTKNVNLLKNVIDVFCRADKKIEGSI